MKKLGEFFIFSLLFLLVLACSSDDEGTDGMDNSEIVGTWNLTEVNINIAQDVDQDGTSSTNLVDELSCLTGVLTINENGTWTGTVTTLSISPVTGDFYTASCNGSASLGGSWVLLNNQLNLNSTNFETLSLSGNSLTEEIGEDLPGILSKVFVKQ